MKKTKNNTDNVKSGFTIIEVTLVTAFIALLLIAIATILVNIAALYQKGVTLKAINSVGRNLITELTTSINSAPSVDTVSLCNTMKNESSKSDCLDSNASRFIYQERTGSYSNDFETLDSVQLGGVFCTGDYSYVWNTYYGIDSRERGNSRDTIQIQYNANQNYDDPFTLVRFKDPNYLACSTNVDPNSYSDNNSFNDSGIIDVRTLKSGLPNTLQPNEPESGFLASSEDIDLDLYEFTIFPISQDQITLRSFFSGTFILATSRGDVNVTRSGDYCDMTNQEGAGDGTTNIFDLGSNFNYCGINKFNFAARTAGNSV